VGGGHRALVAQRRKSSHLYGTDKVPTKVKMEGGSQSNAIHMEDM
jgi:hypothetical protein